MVKLDSDKNDMASAHRLTTLDPAARTVSAPDASTINVSNEELGDWTKHDGLACGNDSNRTVVRDARRAVPVPVPFAKKTLDRAYRRWHKQFINKCIKTNWNGAFGKSRFYTYNRLDEVNAYISEMTEIARANNFGLKTKYKNPITNYFSPRGFHDK
jgi:hypothetical protein